MSLNFILFTSPISVNALYTGRRFLTQKGQTIKDSMAWEFKGQYKGQKMLEGDLALTIHFFFKDKRKDIDSCVKALLDSMQGIVFYNDRQIRELHVFKEVTSGGQEKSVLEVRKL